MISSSLSDRCEKAADILTISNIVEMQPQPSFLGSSKVSQQRVMCGTVIWGFAMWHWVQPLNRESIALYTRRLCSLMAFSEGSCAPGHHTGQWSLVKAAT